MKYIKFHKLSREDFKEILSLNSQIAYTFLRLALEFFEDKSYDDFIKTLENFIKIEPTNGIFHTLKLLFLLRLKNYKTTLKLLIKQIEVDPYNVVNWCEKFSILMYYLKEFEQALACCFLGINPDSGKANSFKKYLLKLQIE